MHEAATAQIIRVRMAENRETSETVHLINDCRDYVSIRATQAAAKEHSRDKNKSKIKNTTSLF